MSSIFCYIVPKEDLAYLDIYQHIVLNIKHCFSDVQNIKLEKLNKSNVLHKNDSAPQYFYPKLLILIDINSESQEIKLIKKIKI